MLKRKPFNQTKQDRKQILKGKFQSCAIFFLQEFNWQKTSELFVCFCIVLR